MRPAAGTRTSSSIVRNSARLDRRHGTVRCRCQPRRSRPRCVPANLFRNEGTAPRSGDGGGRGDVHDRTLRWTASRGRLPPLVRSPRYIIEAPTSDDLRRAAELVERYADLRLGGTDASVIALAERLATARSSHWTAATSLSFRHPPPQASPFFRRDLRQRSRRPLRSRRSQSNSRIIGEMVTIGERPVSAIIGFCPLAATSFCPTDGHPTGEREVLTERECPRPPRIWSRPPAHITPNAGSAR